mgnify:CR=1 FL=1
MCCMSKAFTKENDSDTEDDDGIDLSPPLPPGGKNYITPEGCARLRAEWLDLMERARHATVDTVHRAARNGDRADNGE